MIDRQENTSPSAIPAVVIALLLAMGSMCPTHIRAADAPPLAIDHMRAAVYTKEFAKRFALPNPEPGTEPSGGMQAMEFAVEPGPKHSFGYNCKLKLYLDSKLPIAYPEEGVAGSDRMFMPCQSKIANTSENDSRDIRA